MNKILTALLALGCAGMAYAQDVPQKDEKPAPPAKQDCDCRKDMRRGPEGRQSRQNKDMRPGEMIRANVEADAKIKEKFPAEYAEIQKLRQDGMEKLKAAQDKYFDLAEKAEVKLPGAKNHARMKAFQAKYEKELAEIKKLAETDPKAAGEKMKALLDKEGIRPPMPREGKGMKNDGPREGKGMKNDGPREGKGMNGRGRGHGRSDEGNRPMPPPPPEADDKD